MPMSSIRCRKALALLTVASGVLLAAQPARAGRDPLPVAAAIDREVDRRLAEADVPTSPQADDAEFLRRVTLDVTGHIPTLARTTAFLDSNDPDKRARLIDDLLSSPDYARHFATVWRNRMVPLNPVKGKAPPDRFGPWLAEQFQRNRGWDRIVSDLLTADGDIAKEPQTAFVMANSEDFRPRANLLTGSAARLFLGVQLRCAECHNHPFAPWKQADFWATAAFFGRLHINSKNKKGPPFILNEDPDPDPASAQAPAAAIVIPLTAGKAAGQVVRARYLGGTEPGLPAEGALRPAFADWVTSPENPYFARAAVNRMWAHFFGRGLVNPVDDLRDDNPPSHPALLDLLADEFRASGHDLKHLVRCLCNSRAYQRGSGALPANEKERELFSRMAVKPLSAEAFYDSLAVVFAVDKSAPARNKKPDAGRLQAASPEAREEFVRFFRAQGDADGNGLQQGIPQFLRLLNGADLNAGSPLIDQLVHSKLGPELAVETLYLATLSRRPRPEEVELMSGYVSRRAEPEEGYAGVLWILVNSGEFVLNH
jgi:hypothetical protein